VKTELKNKLWFACLYESESETAALKTAGSSQTEGLPQTENQRTSGWDHETRAECCRSPLCWSQWTTAAAAAGWCDCTEQLSFRWNTASVLCPVSSVQDLCWRKPKDTRSVNITQTCIQCNIQHMVGLSSTWHLYARSLHLMHSYQIWSK